MSEKRLNIKKILRFASYIVVVMFVFFVVQNLIEYGLNINKYKLSIDDLTHIYIYLVFGIVASYLLDILSEKFKKSAK